MKSKMPVHESEHVKPDSQPKCKKSARKSSLSKKTGKSQSRRTKSLTKLQGPMPKYTGNREVDLEECYKALMKQENIEMFKMAAGEILPVLEQYEFKANPSSATVLSTRKPVDSFARTLVPDDHQGNKCHPICIYGDGNCLARTGSIFVFNDEDHWKEV